MRSLLTVFTILIGAMAAVADSPDIRSIVDGHIIPRYHTMAVKSDELAEAAQADCSPNNSELVAAYHDAFSAWVSVSHLRFGPSEQDNRAFALAFWPDPRGSTPAALEALIQRKDPVVFDSLAFDDVSIAGRGFYALEFLLFDAAFAPTKGEDYYCALVQALTADIATTATAIHEDWQNSYANQIADPTNETYRTANEAAQQIFTALLTGLEFTSQTRLGRPIGTFNRPRPNRAEVRRSGRSKLHVILSLEATRDLALLISDQNQTVDLAFQNAIQRAEIIDDPIFASVTDPQGRLRLEALQQAVDSLGAILSEEIGQSLGITAGFNAMDGD